MSSLHTTTRPWPGERFEISKMKGEIQTNNILKYITTNTHIYIYIYMRVLARCMGSLHTKFQKRRVRIKKVRVT
jgi:hypothetical protein